LPEAEGLAIRTYTQVDKTMLENAPKLKVVGRAGVGVDNIDLMECNERGVAVVHTPNANTESVVEFVLTTMLANIRNIRCVTGGLSQKEWDSLRDASMTKNEFSETTLGIIGFGRIGSRLGKMAKQLGFEVLFNDLLNIDKTNGCSQVGIEQLLFESDIISLHIDGRYENKHFCNSNIFRQMKNNTVFINTARGFVVDSYALTEFLKNNTTASAILDVHDPEPISSDYPLLHLPNATLYPHIACKTTTASINMGWVVKDIYSVLCGKQPVFQVKT
jgi:D-3-phosphoglycerate dehydrogenase